MGTDALTVEIIPRIGQNWPKTWEYLDSQRTHLNLTVPPAPRPDTTQLGDEFIVAFNAAFARWMETHPKNDIRMSGGGQNEGAALARRFQQYLNGTGAWPENKLPFSLWISLKLPLVAQARLFVAHHGEFAIWRFLGSVGRGYDLRTLAAALELAGVQDAVELISTRIFGWKGLDGHRPDNVWPFLWSIPAGSTKRWDCALTGPR